MQTTLVIMAAGIGSRYGAGIKQLEQVGRGGEIIMDYSLHDAIEAGFNKIVFIIRPDIEDEFRKRIGNRIEKVCQGKGVEVVYAFQVMDDIPEGFEVPEERVKPWGTGQAVLAARDLIHEPFVVINADDYYGKEAYKSLYNFLQTEREAGEYAMAGFVLKNTLSDNGAVTRGLCETDEKGYLTSIKETRNIVKTAQGAEANGQRLDDRSSVSMNMWAFGPEVIGLLETGFKKFLMEADDLTKDEYLLPIFIGKLLEAGLVEVKVIPTSDRWFGITYQEDKPAVKAAFENLIAEGLYGERLFD